MFIVEEIQRTPQDLFLQPHGVLHMVTISCHMEYSRWSFIGAIWSALGFITEVKIYCHMKYSIWLFYDAIWSTPYGRNLRPHGGLHNVVKNVYCWRNIKNATRLIWYENMKHSIWQEIGTTRSTPHGIKKWPYGVLQITFVLLIKS